MDFQNEIQRLKGWLSGLIGKPAERLLGLDIGPHVVTFVEVQKQYGRYEVDRWGSETSGSSFLEHGRIINRSVLAEALQSLVDKHELRGSRVAIAVNGPSVMVKRIQVPKRYGDDLDGYFLWERPPDFFYDPDDVYLDYAISRSGSYRSSSETMDLLFVASKRDAVDERLDVLTEVGLTPIVCDVDGLALCNLASLHPEIRKHRSYLLAHVHNGMMNLIVVDDGMPLIVRDVNLSLCDRMESKLADDHRSILGRHVQAGFISTNTSLNQASLEGEVLGEIQRTVGGARDMQPDLDIEVVFIAGSLDVSSDWLDEMSQSLVLPVQWFDPLSSLSWTSKDLPLASSVCLASGLALRSEMEVPR